MSHASANSPPKSPTNSPQVLGRLAARADAGGALHEALTKHVLAQARRHCFVNESILRMSLTLLFKWHTRSCPLPRSRAVGLISR